MVLVVKGGDEQRGMIQGVDGWVVGPTMFFY